MGSISVSAERTGLDSLPCTRVLPVVIRNLGRIYLAAQVLIFGRQTIINIKCLIRCMRAIVAHLFNGSSSVDLLQGQRA